MFWSLYYLILVMIKLFWKIIVYHSTSSFAFSHSFGSVLTAFLTHVSDGSSLLSGISTPLNRLVLSNHGMGAFGPVPILEKRASNSLIFTIFHRSCDIYPSGLLGSMSTTIRCRFAISLATAVDLDVVDLSAFLTFSFSATSLYYLLFEGALGKLSIGCCLFLAMRSSSRFAKYDLPGRFSPPLGPNPTVSLLLSLGWTWPRLGYTSWPPPCIAFPFLASPGPSHVARVETLDHLLRKAQKLLFYFFINAHRAFLRCGRWRHSLLNRCAHRWEPPRCLYP